MKQKLSKKERLKSIDAVLALMDQVEALFGISKPNKRERADKIVSLMHDKFEDLKNAIPNMAEQPELLTYLLDPVLAEIMQLMGADS